ncbi:MAG: metallophosphoesterase [Actinomycetota bacterium]
MIRFGPEASPPQVWAVEDDAVQLCWGDLPAGPVTATSRSGNAAATVDHAGGPGSLDLASLLPDTAVTIDLRWTGGATTLDAITLPSPPGPQLTRFATISDLHLGAVTWGALRTMVDRSDHPVPHPYRCASAAVAEAVAWGASYLVIKGDAVHHELPDHFEYLARLVDEFPDLPMLLIPGNHDVDARSEVIPTTVGERGLPYVRAVDHVDLPGVRIIAADTTVRGRGVGTVERVGPAIEARVAEADRPSFVAIHQQLQPARLPRYWPAGIPAPGSTAFLDRLDRLDSPVTISSGHTHRNRSRRHGSLLLTEVASTKDWPGVWAGYAVHEGGIRQVVRRIAAPEAMAWTEYSRGALLGLWSRWSPGPIEQRCLTNAWAEDRSYA